MIDKEKVIKGMEQFKTDFKPFCGNRADWERFDAGLAMLKELEQIAPSVCGSKEPDGHGCWRYLCGKCKKPIDHKDRFCKRCGQAVKWDD